MRMHVLFHDNCFDGAASAAVFSRFYRERIRPDATLSYQGLSHQAGGTPVPESAFQGDENAIVDFRYSQSPRLTWWFDHHASAFQTDGDEAHFLADTSGRKFHDARRKSCTVYLADVARDRFGFDPGPMVELLEWAEIIDGAQFPSPQMAVALREPALQLMTVLEANHDPDAHPRGHPPASVAPALGRGGAADDPGSHSGRCSSVISTTARWCGARRSSSAGWSSSTSPTRASTR